MLAAPVNWESNRSEAFTLLVLVSFVALLQYMRLFKNYRALIKLIIECADACIDFLTVSFVLLTGLAFSTYYREIINQDLEVISFSQHGYSMLMTVLGDFELASENNNSFVMYFVFIFACLAILIVMMNLLIGIISEKLAEVLE